MLFHYLDVHVWTGLEPQVGSLPRRRKKHTLSLQVVAGGEQRGLEARQHFGNIGHMGARAGIGTPEFSPSPLGNPAVPACTSAACLTPLGQTVVRQLHLGRFLPVHEVKPQPGQGKVLDSEQRILEQVR